MIKRQMTPFFLSTFYALSIGLFDFRILITSNLISMGSSFPYVLDCKIHLHDKGDTFKPVNTDTLFLLISC